MNKKKDIERAILDQFLISLDTSLKPISITECETPDFIIETITKKVSIELTNLMDPVIKEKEEFKNVIIKKAEKLFKERNDIEIYVVINFKDIEIKGTQKNLKEYSQKIFEIVENVYLENCNSEFDITVKKAHPFPDFLNRIYVTNKVSAYKWQRSGAHKVEWVSIDWMFEKILSKQKNIKRYYYPFDQNWLLLITNLGFESSAYRFDFISFDQLQTDFDRVFVYRYMQNEIITLK